MNNKYYLHSGKDIKKEAPKQTQNANIQNKSTVAEPVKRISSSSAAGLIITICAAAVLVYSYIFASGNLDEYIDKSVYENLDGMYIGGLGEASYVFAQKIEDSVLAGILGLDYVNSEKLGEAVYTSGSGK